MISVIIPTFNEEAGVEACLKSLCDQTILRDQYEIIVVDGNSKDRTRAIAEKYADKVFIQTSRKVGGARNDGAMAAKYDLLATTDADCFLPRDWLEKVIADFARYPDASTIYGIVYPLEPGVKHKLSLLGYNIVSRLGYLTGTIYMTLGCNTAFRRDLFLDAGMYTTVDAGDDFEIARRMKKYGRVKLDTNLRVGFSMRRYIEFGAMKSIYQWLYIVMHGGTSGKYQYTGKEYRKKE
ncbi:MAG: glycosyltransferase [Methanocalculaceae archaeon]|jgi:glycosyltransferase involved in cell wall biosynthesis|nr:glycosyltransferase [Methanocalculaceae archaeon]